MTETAADAVAIDALLALPPQEAIDFFRSKGFVQGFAWQDVWQGEHARAFTVAKAMSQELLEVIRAEVDAAIADGTTLETFRANLRPRLEQLGWWGRANMLDPLTGRFENVQLGSPRRLRIIFDVNLRTAYAAGRWQRAVDNEADRPFLRYVCVDDRKTRPEHRAWGTFEGQGVILPIRHPWWKTHYGPCGWGCRCTASSLDQATMDRRGWHVTEEPPVFAEQRYHNPRTGQISSVPGGIDPGFAYNVGQAYLRGLTPPPLPADGTATLAAAAGPEAGVAVAGFLAAFGLQPDGEKVFVDAGGWPLAIGRTLFVDAAGNFDPPPPDRFDALAAAGRVIAHPAEIRWVWRPGADGRPQLLRRYLGQAGELGVVADLGRAGWRFTTPGERRDEGATDGDATAWRRGG